MILEELAYRILDTPNAQIRELLENTVYGTKGGMQIRHLDTYWKLDELISPDFHVLYEGDKLVAVVVYSKRRCAFNDIELDTLYIRYFSVSLEFQNLGIAQFLTKKAVLYYRETLVKPTVVYAYIEAKNLKSQAVGDHFEPMNMGSFSPIYFSRFFPKKKKDINHSKDEFYRFYKALGNRNLVYTRESDKNVKYFTKSVGGEFAALRCYQVSWEVINYPNNNFLMKHFLSRIPIINRLVEGSKLNFVAVDAINWNSNKILFEVLEAALSEFKLSKLMLFADNGDERYFELRQSSLLGFMSKVQRPPKVSIQYFFHDCDETMIKGIKQCPSEIRGFDVT